MRVYYALRLVHALAKRDGEGEVTVFLMAGAVLTGKAGQTTPEGFYSVERMLSRVLSSKGRVLGCGGLRGGAGHRREDEIIPGARCGEATLAADRVLVF